jgi:hypothetical protein
MRLFENWVLSRIFLYKREEIKRGLEKITQ